MKTNKIAIKSLKERTSTIKYKFIEYSKLNDYYYYHDRVTFRNNIQFYEIVKSNSNYYISHLYTIIFEHNKIFIMFSVFNGITFISNTDMYPISKEQLSGLLDYLEKAESPYTTDEECQTLLKTTFNGIRAICHRLKGIA